MTRTRYLLAGAASAIAIAALPLNLESIASGTLELSSAFAKSDHSGGNGGGNGGGHGHSGEHGKSGDTHGSGGVGPNSPGRVKLITGEETHGTKSKKAADTRVAKSSKSHKKTDDIETAALPDEAAPGTTAKSLNARLAGLHSLNRNFRAYLNSQDPRMAKIRDFVLASANLDIANEKLDKAKTDFHTALTDADIVAFDGSSIYGSHPTLGELQARLDTLNAIDPSTLSPADAAALDQEKTDLANLLGSDEAIALGKAEDAVDAASVGTDDEALKAALIDAANKNRVAQYGDDYVNDDVLNWAKDLLGVGDAVGKIDEVRATLETDSQ